MHSIEELEQENKKLEQEIERLRCSLSLLNGLRRELYANRNLIVRNGDIADRIGNCLPYDMREIGE